MTYSVSPAPAGLFLPDAVLDALGAGLLLLAPSYAANDPATLLTLSYVAANAVAQRLLGLPDQPTGLFGTAGPQETALLAFCRDTFWAGEAGYFAPGYVAADGTRWQVVAQRHEAQLVVSFTALREPASPAEAEALALARQAAQAADRQLAQERAVIRQVFAQTPAAICLLRGPEHRFEYVNAAFAQLFANRQLEGLPVAVGLPEAVGQGFIALLDRVYATGKTFVGTEVPMTISQPDGQPPKEHYFNFTYQAHLLDGHAEYLSVFAYDVTEQVLARQQRESYQQQWQHLFEQAPVAITQLRGPQHVLELANAASWALWSVHPQALGQPLLTALPELAGQGLAQHLDEVLATGEPYLAHAQPIILDRGGRLETVYLDMTCQPIYGTYDCVEGISLVATNVSAQVVVHQQVQVLNEELYAANEELRTNNDTLTHTQGQLQQLNMELEARVQARTREQVLARRQVQQLNAELEARVAAGIEEAQHARTDAERQRERLERFFAQAPAAVCVLDGPELVFELVNPSFQGLFPDRPLLGLPLLEALPEFENLPVLQQMQQVYATGETNEETNGLIPLAQYAGGPVVDFHFHYVQQARYDAQGRIDGVLVFALNITAQVRVQQLAERLQEQVLAAVHRRAQEREIFYQIFAQTPAAVALMRGPDHRFEYVNQAWEELFLGRALQGLPIVEALPEAESQGFVALLEQTYHTGETVVGTEVPLIVTAPDGTPQPVKWMSFTFQAYRANGVIVGVSGFAYDVTDQVRARQQREAGLAQLHTIFEQAPVGIAQLTGPDYVVDVVNPALCAMWGRERAHVLGQPLFAVLPEVMNQGIPELLDEVRRTGQSFVAEEEPVQLLRHGQLETIYFQFVYQPITDKEGQVTAIVVVATDVSARVASRQQLAQANEELRTANAQLTHTNTDLDNFIYTASHDLKAPIANIEGLLLMLRKQLPAATQQTGLVPRVLGMMQESVGRFQLTIAQLTDLSRLQQTRTEPAQTVELAAVVEAVRLDLAPLLEATSTQLALDISAGATAQFAPQHLRSIIYNLLSNAIKYHHPSRVPQVQLRCHSAENATLLEVQDNGLGLSEWQQGKLFTLFQRLHTHVEGSGVGLYMVKRIVENAGGTIAVRSELGVGSTFSVWLPALPV